MTSIVHKHYFQKYTREVYNLCSPLQSLNITYFAHVNIDKNGQFSTLSNNPEFIEHYLSHQYYNCDIHMARNFLLAPYVLWDDFELTGESLQLHLDSFAFGVQHTFTITEVNESGYNYYHFANNIASHSINQTYLNNIDLLKLFISEFNKKVKRSASLSRIYDSKFTLVNETGGYTIQNGDLLNQRQRRLQFYEELKKELRNDLDPVTLPQQQMRCLSFLKKGMTNKEIARELNISPRTVEKHLKMAQENLGCRNSKEMIVRCTDLMLYQDVDLLYPPVF